MDVRMPRVDGIKACEQIRAFPGGRDIAVVFVSAQRDVETFDRALAAGGDDFLTKPFRPYEELKHQRDHLQRIERSAGAIDSAGRRPRARTDVSGANSRGDTLAPTHDHEPARHQQR
jgi:CheY-like chemotaxis protein